MLNLQDTTTVYIDMCKESSVLKEYFETHKSEVTNKDIIVKEEQTGTLIWLPNQKQLQELLDINDNLESNEFLEDITDFFEDIKKTVKFFPWINTMEKAMLHLLMERKNNEFWNVKLNVWQVKH